MWTLKPVTRPICRDRIVNGSKLYRMFQGDLASGTTPHLGRVEGWGEVTGYCQQQITGQD